MKNLKVRCMNYLKISFSILILSLISNVTLSNEIQLKIRGNNFTDKDVILSLIKDKPNDLSEEYSNYLLKTLNNSKLFENVSIKIDNNNYIINIAEYPNINKFFFKNNERIKDEELKLLIDELELNNLNPTSINTFINETNKIYESFGFNSAVITYTEDYFEETNTADLYFDFDEGKITKINRIFFEGNNAIDNSIIKSIIDSKTKTLINILANNNFKRFVLENDSRLISKMYVNKGFIDVKVNYKIEYLQSNKVNIYFYITEGDQYLFSSIQFNDQNNILNKDSSLLIEEKIKKSFIEKEHYSLEKINTLKNEISDIILDTGIEFFEINSLEKKNNQNVDILYNILSVNPKYAKQINVYGNSRTFDNVIRRELEIVEGDAVYKSQIDRIQKKLNSLNLFKSVEIVEKEIDDNLVDIEINVEEKQTGSINAGVSVGTIDGFAVVAGLSERNFYGTGRSVKALLNTSEDRNQYTLETTDRLSYENDIDVSYKVNYIQEDFSNASSYKLDTFTSGVGFAYKVNDQLRHNLQLDYVIKDYSITNSSTVASTISKSAGENISFLLSNNLLYSTLNSGFIPKNGRYLKFSNFIETPSSSNNGYVRNIVTYKNYKLINKNIFSLQSRVGNVISLSNNDILTNDKFSLGGRWLRGFDTFGAGPRNSRSSYVGGNNIFVTKLDYSREIFNNSDFPIYFNLFNDYGLLWENKTKPTNNDSSLRSSVGFGIKYYSPIGPIGFSWAFPIQDESYDIPRMFLFSVGNID